ncbi:Pre-mRNA-splicing factor CWC26 [Endogone sp. FLAS-F59071]|nr:Pre-mRNA-splicing factor CWC26 [Endogone sp. FLAS-F59071]|eukprot:RUS19927.1 Pre-mRNA-splicing factor CWC26 [Endogone sp. FLAS-F59071]
MDRQEYIKKKYLATGPGDQGTKDYIAKKYLSGGSDESTKKKKKKVKSTSSFPSKLRKGNIGIIDEDEFGGRPAKEQDEDDEDDVRDPIIPLIVEERGTSFKGRTDGWITIRDGDAPLPRHAVDGMDFAEEEDERPIIVGEIPKLSPPPPSHNRSSSPPSKRKREFTLDPPLPSKHRSVRSSSPSHHSQRPRSPEPRMSSGARVGLQTYEETRSEIERLRAEHEERLRSLDPQQSGRDAETVYRDASGRKVDMGVKKAEEKRARQEEMERQEKMMEWGKGLVQRREKEEQERREKEEGAKPLARYADDKEINEDLKNRDRWNDPAAAFLTQKKSKGPKKPAYKGSWPPNRFGIPPGYRWDGVDRSNGFERELFARQNTRTARAAEAYAWASEDM